MIFGSGSESESREEVGTLPFTDLEFQDWAGSQKQNPGYQRFEKPLCTPPLRLDCWIKQDDPHISRASTKDHQPAADLLISVRYCTTLFLRKSLLGLYSWIIFNISCVFPWRISGVWYVPCLWYLLSQRNRTGMYKLSFDTARSSCAALCMIIFSMH